MRRAAAWACWAALAALAALIVWTLWAGPEHGPLPARSVYLAAIGAALAAGAGLLAGSGLRHASALVFFASLAALLGNTRLMASIDTISSALLPVTLVRERTLTVAGHAPFHSTDRSDIVPLPQGRFASKYPLVTPLLALPLAAPVALGRAPLAISSLNAVQKMTAALLAAGTVAFLFAAFRRLAGDRIAIISAALVLFGTAVLPILGQALWQHTGAAFFLASGIAALFTLGDDRGALRSAAVGACAGLLVAARPSDFPLSAALLLALATIERRPARLAAAAAVAAVPVVAMLAYQQALFGNFLKTGYRDEATIGWKPPWPDGAEAFAGLLVSPGRGLFMASPILLPAAAMLAVPPADAPHRRALRILGAGALAVTVLIAHWWSWHGAFSAGPRMLSETIPVIALGLPLALQAAARSPRRKALLAALAALSIVTNGLLAYDIPRLPAKLLVWDLDDGPWTVRAWPPLAWLTAASRGEATRSTSPTR